MASEYVIGVRPFDMGTDKEAALKPLEEAAEAFNAWQNLDGYKRNKYVMGEAMAALRSSVVYECADVIQATCNMLSGLDVAQAELDEAMRAVHESNARRGRYGSDDTD
ncbi:MAG: hypothetical protein SO057_07295 [Atopobiaceae bacterium]|nr:hypothetical protein [Atopobiaceae bacterium]